MFFKQGRGRCKQRALPVFFLILWLLLAAGAEAQLSEAWQASLKQAQVPGALVLRLEGAGPVQTEIYADPQRDEPAISNKTWIPLGRLSALLNTALLLEGVQKGHWSLDENINTYLNQLQVVNPFATPLTLRHLLQERDGFPEFYQGHWLEQPKRVPTLTQLLNYGLKPLVKEPGSMPTPGSWGPVLAAYLLEAQDEKTPAEQRMRQRWGLNSLKTGLLQRGVVQGTLLESGKLWDYPSLYSAAPASDQRLLTPEDLSKWMEILVGRRPGLTEASRRFLYLPTLASGKAQSLGFLPYASGPVKGGPVFYRESNQMGLTQFLVVQPQTGKAAYLLLRREAPGLARQWIAQWLGIQPQARQTLSHSEPVSPDGFYGYPHFHTQSLSALARLNRGLLEVKSLSQGDLRIFSHGHDPFGGFASGESIWEPVGVGLFQIKGGTALIHLVPDGKNGFQLLSHQASGGVYLPLKKSDTPLFQWGLWAVFMLTFALGFGRNFWQYWQVAAPIEPEEVREGENVPPYLLMALAAGAGLVFLMAFPWVFFMENLPGEMTLAWRDPLNPWLFGLLALPLFQLFFTGVSALLALGALRQWQRWDRLNGLLQLMATGGYLFWLQTWHLIGFQV